MNGVQQPMLGDYCEPNEDVNRLSNSVIGAAIEVHKILGPGYAKRSMGTHLRLN